MMQRIDAQMSETKHKGRTSSITEGKQADTAIPFILKYL